MASAATDPPRDGGGFAGDTVDRVARALQVAHYAWEAGSDVIRMSAALSELFGFEPGDWSVSRQRSLMHPDDVARFDRTQRAFFRSGETFQRIEYRVLSPDGVYRWWQARNFYERDASGRVVRLTGAVSDITAAKRHEAENRALLARQAASIEVLEAISASPDDPQPVFELIARHARVLCEAAQATVTEFDGALLHMRARSGFDQAAIDLADRNWPQPPGASTLAGRVVLSGAIVHKRANDAIEPGYAPILRVSTRNLGEAVEIRVRDNGTGIPADVREKLFQPFFTTKPTGEGTGLGLSMSHDIVVKQHNGSITVDSQVGSFSEFTVTLPRHMLAGKEPAR